MMLWRAGRRRNRQKKDGNNRTNHLVIGRPHQGPAPGEESPRERPDKKEKIGK